MKRTYIDANVPCPGRLRPTGESSNGATLGQDSTLLRPPAKVERLVKHPLSLSTKPYKIQTVLRDLAAQENMEGDPYDQIQEASNYIDELEGYINYLLAALSNTTPDIIKKKDDAIRGAINQIEYLHEKFRETGSGNAVIARLQDALSNTTPYLSQDVKGVYKYEIDSPDELDAGLHGFSDEITIIVDSGEPGGDPTGEDSFEEYMRQALIEWYDGAKVVVKKANE